MAGAKLKPIPEGIPWLTDLKRIQQITGKCAVSFAFSVLHIQLLAIGRRGENQLPKGIVVVKTHLGNVDAKRDEDELERRRQQASINTYTGSSSMDVDDFSVHQENHSRPDMSFFAAPSTTHFTEKENIRFQFEQILIRELFLDDEDASETNVLETLWSLGLNDDDESGNLSIGENLFLPAADTENHCDYAPYPNKLVCDLEAFSVDENDPQEAVKRNFSNPQIAEHMNFYPEETTGPISEVWQCDRWKEYSPSEHTPMFSVGGKQFYINEAAHA
ncbi:hypothetical protein BT96DRAFT_998458 [Gymnopus androsaceus JB14]|uniref:Uncharacterized protein n=1 Tax=Gymnopus androsaceus JB14 TaxID=1447944 RepID=A0A6A4H8I6_9AGAR|nr:hypothetical protein BT96DRAFT_998458 [Gymnopus androsaceus JB14]